MIKVPAFLYWLLCRIPFVGSSFSRLNRKKEKSESWVSLPSKSLIEAGQKLLTLLVVFVVLGAIGILYWLNTYSGSDSVEPIEGDVQGNSKLAVLLEELRESRSGDIDDASAQLLLLDKRISIADQIIGMEPDEWSESTAAEAKLNATIRRTLLEIELGIDDERYSLQDLAGDYLNSENQRVNSLANLAIVVHGIKKYIGSKEQVDDFRTQQDAIEKIRWTAEASDDNSWLAQEMLDVLRSLNKHTDRDRMKPLFQAFVAGFKNSNLPEIVSILDSIRENYEDGNARLVNVRNANLSSHDQVVAELMRQVNGVLSSSERLQPSDALQLVSRANDLLAISKPENASEILRRLSESSFELSPAVVDEIASVKRKIKLFSNSLVLKGLLDLNGNDVSFTNQNAKHKLLFFTKTDPSSNPLDKIRRLISLVNSSLKRSELELSLVCVHEKVEKDQFAAKQRFVDENPNIGVWFLYTDSDEGKNFIELCPMEKFPYAFLLNEDLTVASAGAQPRLIQEILFKRELESR